MGYFRERLNQSVGCWRLAVLVLFGLVILAFIVPAPTAHALDPATVLVSPEMQQIGVGQNGDVNILVNDYNDPNTSPLGPGLYGAEVQLTFDPSIVEVVDAVPGGSVQMTPGPLLATESNFILFNTANNTLGTIRFVISQLNPAPPQTCPATPTPCSGVLLIIKFKGLVQGTSAINFTLKKLSNASGFEIPSTSVNGWITVANPTAVDVSDFRSTNAGPGFVELGWNTGSEVSLAGFNVWKSAERDSGYAKLNATLIPAKSPGAVNGNTYTFRDNDAAAGVGRFYKLEAIASDGSSKWFGPLPVDISPDCPGLPNLGKLSPVKLRTPANRASVGENVTLHWTASSCAKKYRLQLRRDAPDGTRVRNKKFAETELNLNLESGHTYYWRVRAVMDKRKSAWTEWRSFTVQ